MYKILSENAGLINDVLVWCIETLYIDCRHSDSVLAQRGELQ